MASPLERKRRKIDAIDSRLAALLAERFAVVKSMAGLKKTVWDPERETEVLRRACRRVRGARLRAAVMGVYKEIFKQGRCLLNDNKA